MTPAPFKLTWCPFSGTTATKVRVHGVEPFEGQSWIGPFSHVNIFIGPNNCGKSRVLRDLVQAGSACPSVVRSERLSALLQDFDKDLAQAAPALAPNGPLISNNRVQHEAQECFKRLALIAGGNRSARCRFLINDAAQFMGPAQMALAVARHWLPTPTNPEAPNAALVRLLQRAVEAQRVTGAGTPQFHRVYIPVLRGLRPVDGSVGAAPPDQYETRTHADYFTTQPAVPAGAGPTPGPPQISSGLRAFKEVGDHRNGTTFQQETLDAYEAFLSRRFFDGALVRITARQADEKNKPSNVLWVKIGEEAQRPIFHLGDGLSQLIVHTLPMFLHRDKDLLLFIEEPETHLHPGYQRLLLDAFLSEPCEGSGSRQVFFTTHSNVFMDMTLDSERVQLFRVAKELNAEQARERDAAVIVRAEAQGSIEILRELGCTNSSVLLVNCTLWVEGRTDRLYLAHFLDLLAGNLKWLPKGIQLKEDLHYAFMEYSGSNLVHWSFLDEEQGTDEKRLCGTLFLIADDDGASQGTCPGKAKRHERLREVLGDRFWLLPCREIENLLAPAVLAGVVRSYEGDAIPQLGSFSWSDYAHEPLGHFIEKRVLPAGFTSRRRAKTGHAYADTTGTVKEKESFALRAIALMREWGDLTPEAQELTRAIARFVRASNGQKPIPELDSPRGDTSAGASEHTRAVSPLEST